MSASPDRTRELVADHGWIVLRSVLTLLVLGLLGGCDSGPSLDDLEPGSFALVVGGERVEGRARLVSNDGSPVVEAYLFMEEGGYSVSLTSDGFLADGGTGEFTPRGGTVITPTEDGFGYESGTVERVPGEPGVFRLDLEFKQRPGFGLDFRFESISVEGAVRL